MVMVGKAFGLLTKLHNDIVLEMVQDVYLRGDVQIFRASEVRKYRVDVFTNRFWDNGSGSQ